MSPESHTLSRTTGALPKQSGRNPKVIMWDADCSCGKWHIRNRTATDIRESHAQHVAERLAPKEAADCTCFFSCGEDPEFACSKSGIWHQHSSEPCPVHPDAPIS